MCRQRQRVCVHVLETLRHIPERVRLMKPHEKREWLRGVGSHCVKRAHGSVSEPQVSAVFIWEVTASRGPVLRVASFTWTRKCAVAYLRVWLEVGEVAAIANAVSYLGRNVANRGDVCRRMGLEFGAPRPAVLLHARPKRVREPAIIGRWAAGMKHLFGKPGGLRALR